jgi:hypothetical protein
MQKKSEKKQYEKPVLVYWGNMVEQTQGIAPSPVSLNTLR